MKLRDLLRDQGVDPDKLLDARLGTKLEDGGGITASLVDGQVDVHIYFGVATADPEPEKPKAKPRRKRK